MKLHWKPWEYLRLTDRERALMSAFLEEYAKQKERETRKIK